ncbi:MAG TPA: TlpA disulfide reductase family protein, partial [Gemmatimonadales bacterium]|nr:TlpA disulfide reductase family protein [Gemmatimonadales bacterium]
MLALLLALAAPDLAGPWRGVLDLANAQLRFALSFDAAGGSLCNGPACDRFTAVIVRGDSVTLELADYAATIAAVRRGDSLVGTYRNVGNRGPRSIPFRASRGTWPATTVPAALEGRWDALLHSDFGSSPRVVVFEPGPRGLQGTLIGNTGDYGRFWGEATRDSFALQRFDGAYVYLLAGRIHGDTLRGTFHAGLRGQTPFTAVRSTGKPHLVPPEEFTKADTAPYRFAFRDVEGRLVTSEDARFRGKVLLVDIFGTWCPACHDAAPTLVDLHRTRRARGLEIVGVAFEVSGDSAVDGALLRRYRDKFG